ncbi:hypothetical protein OB920_18175 [Halobacteria archaeon HArc-gm2]|nr:hypothetical protein [Halobacteria archaeon HArc-gm2]
MLEESIKAVFVLPERSRDEAFEVVVEFAETADSYEIEEIQEDDLGARYRVYVSVDDMLLSIIFTDGNSDHPDGNLVQIRYTIGPTLENTSEIAGAKPLHKIAETVKHLYAVLDGHPRAVFGIETYQNQKAPLSVDDLPPTDRKFLTWLDLFPPKEVEAIGRNRLLSAPAPHVEELADGGILLISKHPVTIDPATIDEVADHVGIKCWEDYPHERASASDFED